MMLFFGKKRFGYFRFFFMYIIKLLAKSGNIRQGLKKAQFYVLVNAKLDL